MVWYNLEINGHKCKYTPLAVGEKEYPNCDSDGNILTRVSGKFEKGHFVNEKTGDKHEKAFKLINEKVSKGFSGRIKEVTQEQLIMVESGESEDLLTEKEFLLENEDLYDELLEKEKEVKFGGWFGNGYKAYRVYVMPSKLYKGFCIMKVGRGNKADIIKGLVEDRTDLANLKEKLDSIDLGLDNVNKTKVEDLLEI